jgi:tight adherence protein C
VRLGGGTSPRLAADLAVTRRTPVRHTLDKLGFLLAGLLVGGVAALLPLLGTEASWYPLALAVVLGALGFVAPDVALRSAALTARRRWAHALTVYVDIVGISLAGGAGVDDALYGAASAGQGAEFGLLGAELLAARTRRRTLWNALDELGQRLGVAQLRELAASIDLAGETGSRIRETLLAKAKAMRNRQLSDVEADAQRATETMGVAPALMALAAVLLIGYPAVANFVGS